MKPWVIQSLLTETSSVIIEKAVEQYFIVVLFVLQFYPVCNLSVLDLALLGLNSLIACCIEKTIGALKGTKRTLADQEDPVSQVSLR